MKNRATLRPISPGLYHDPMIKIVPVKEQHSKSPVKNRIAYIVSTFLAQARPNVDMPQPTSRAGNTMFAG